MSLKKSREFRSVIIEGKRYFSKSLKIYYKKSINGSWKLGLAVSKKVGPAVKRNRVKRLLRETYRKMLSDPMIRTNVGYEIVFMAKPEIASSGFHDIFDELKFFLHKM